MSTEIPSIGHDSVMAAMSDPSGFGRANGRSYEAYEAERDPILKRDGDIFPPNDAQAKQAFIFVLTETIIRKLSAPNNTVLLSDDQIEAISNATTETVNRTLKRGPLQYAKLIELADTVAPILKLELPTESTLEIGIQDERIRESATYTGRYIANEPDPKKISNYLHDGRAARDKARADSMEKQPL